MTEEQTTIDGGAVEVPPEDADEARAELARVETEGMMPAVPGSQAVSYRQAVELGHVLAASGYFKDAQGAAGAAVKVMAGSELGFSPIASIMGVHIVEGRPMLSGRLLGAVVKRHPDFDYRIDSLKVTLADNGLPTEGECAVTMLHRGEDLDPVSTFTIAEARVAGLVKEKSNWHKYPRKMLFWRALSWGVDFHCPHLLGGMPLVAVEDGEDESGALQRELNPPAERPPALTDPEAEAKRAAAREVYDELRELNPTIIVPGKFANLIAGAEHSHSALDNLIASLIDLLNVEQGIVETLAKLREFDDSVADKALADTARASTRREVLDHLKATLGEAADDGGEG